MEYKISFAKTIYLAILLTLSITCYSQDVFFTYTEQIGKTQTQIITNLSKDKSVYIFKKSFVNKNNQIVLSYDYNTTAFKTDLSFTLDANGKCYSITTMEDIFEFPYLLEKFNNTSKYVKTSSYVYVNIEGTYKVILELVTILGGEQPKNVMITVKALNKE